MPFAFTVLFHPHHSTYMLPHPHFINRKRTVSRVKGIAQGPVPRSVLIFTLVKLVQRREKRSPKEPRHSFHPPCILTSSNFPNHPETQVSFTFYKGGNWGPKRWRAFCPRLAFKRQSQEFSIWVCWIPNLKSLSYSTASSLGRSAKITNKTKP